MYLTTEKKAEIFAEYGASAKDTGSAEGQIALFSYRISHLTEHLKQNRKDHNTERSLIALVGKRRKLLNYLKKTDIARYRAIVEKLIRPSQRAGQSIRRSAPRCGAPFSGTVSALPHRVPAHSAPSTYRRGSSGESSCRIPC